MLIQKIRRLRRNSAMHRAAQRPSPQERSRFRNFPFMAWPTMADDIRTQAATYIDGEFRRVHDDLIHEHRRQEQRMLSWEKSRLESHARNREVAGLRYAPRLRAIEEERDRNAAHFRPRHNSIGGRLAALTKKGREQQAAELQRLDEHAERLQAQAGRNYQALTERQFQVEQRDRIRTARELKDFRHDHEEMR